MRVGATGVAAVLVMAATLGGGSDARAQAGVSNGLLAAPAIRPVTRPAPLAAPTARPVAPRPMTPARPAPPPAAGTTRPPRLTAPSAPKAPRPAPSTPGVAKPAPARKPRTPPPAPVDTTAAAGQAPVILRPPQTSWGPGGPVAAGAALGVLQPGLATSVAGPPPANGMCWYYKTPDRRVGFWDQCSAARLMP